MGANSSAEPEPKQDSCVPSCCSGQNGQSDIVEQNSPRKNAVQDMLEDGLNAQKLADAGAAALGNVQAALGVVGDALASDEESPRRSSHNWFGGGDSGSQGGGGFFGIAWNSNSNEETPAEDAVGKARQFAKKEFIQIQSFIQHSHVTAKLTCCAVAVALLTTSIFGLVGLFDAKFQAYQYVFSVWNIFWAFVMILMDGKPSWFGKLGDYQKKLFGIAPSLAKTRGRSIVHFYVGTVNLAMCSAASNFFWWMTYVCQGGALVVCSLMMLLHGHGQDWQRRKRQQQKPSILDAARAAVTGAGTAAGILKEEVFEVEHYIMENHFTVKILCFLLAVGLATVSALGMFNLFGAIFHPFFYVLGVYNFFFATLIAVVDGEPSFFQRCGDIQTKVYRLFPFLSSQKGRAFLHFYVGSINVVLLPGGFMDWAYVGVGSALMLCSVLMLTHYNWCSGKLPTMEDLS